MADGRYPRRSPAQWQGLIERQTASGLSQVAFCAREGAAVSSFQYWKHRLRQAQACASDGATLKAADEEAGLFAPLVAPTTRHAASEPAHSAGWELELDLGDGVWLRFRRGTP